MPPILQKSPTATDVAGAAEDASPDVAGRSDLVSSPAGRPENVSAATLAAELARKARARRTPPPAGKTPAGNQAKPTPEPESEASAASEEPESDEAKAASAPTEVETDETPADASAAAEEGESEDSAADEAATEESKTDVPKAVREMQKRIAKLTAVNKALKAQLQGGPQNQATREPAPAAPPEHTELREIDGQIATFEAHLAWFDENPEGGVYKDADGREIANVSAERIPSLRRQTERRLAELQGTRAARAERITADLAMERKRHDEEAVKTYPWLANPEAPEFAEAQEMLSTLPDSAVRALHSHPQARRLLAWAVTGKRAEVARSRPTANDGRPIPPKVMAPPSTAAPRVSPTASAERQLAEAEAAYAKSGRQDDFKRVLKLRKSIGR